MRNIRAFTLIELLVVVAIITALIAILLPSLNRAVRTANDMKCGSKLRQSAMAAVNRAIDNRGSLWVWNISPTDAFRTPTLFKVDGNEILSPEFVSSYLPSLEVWSCTFSEVPNIEDSRNTRGWAYGSFAYWPLQAGNNLGPDFGVAGGYPTSIALARATTPLMQDAVADNDKLTWAPTFLSNHTTENYSVFSGMITTNPSNIVRRASEIEDVRGANIAMFDLSVNWHAGTDLRIANPQDTRPYGAPLYSYW